jgi:glycogen synthase kinase 3 beta
MSELALNVVDQLPCDMVPLRENISAWLGGSGEIKSIGAFAGCSLLRIQEGRKEPLQLFALEPVDVCLLTKSAEPLEDGWVELEYTELPEVVGVESGLTMQTHKFDPGCVVIPLDVALMPPIVRVIGKRAVAPPRNSLLPRSLAAPRSAPRAQHPTLPLPAVSGDRADAEQLQVSSEAIEPDVADTGHLDHNQEGRRQPLHQIVAAAEDAGVDSATPSSGSKRYRTLNSVGKGSFGTVYLAEDTEDGHQVAVKRICQTSGHSVATREVELLGKIEHPCVVSLLDSFEEQESQGKLIMNLVMEYLPQNLHQKINGKPLEFAHVRCFSFQLLRALAHLSGLQICHRDLKPENILLNHRALKLADFGSAKLLGSGPSSNYICSRWWRAPELVLGTAEYSTSVDWWSCGCVIGEMMSGRALFMGQSSLGQIYVIMQALGTPSPEDIQAMHPRRGLGRIAEQLMKLSKLERAARPWPKLLPAFASEPDALQLPEKLLMYTPSARLHPAEALCSALFASLPEDDESLGPLPVMLFKFTEAELASLSMSSRELLLSFATRYTERKPVTLQVETPSTEVATHDSYEPHCDETSSSADESGVEAEEIVPLRLTRDSPDERRLKRRRISQKTLSPNLIRLDSEDIGEEL